MTLFLVMIALLIKKLVRGMIKALDLSDGLRVQERRLTLTQVYTPKPFLLHKIFYSVECLSFVKRIDINFFCKQLYP